MDVEATVVALGLLGNGEDGEHGGVSFEENIQLICDIWLYYIEMIPSDTILFVVFLITDFPELRRVYSHASIANRDYTDNHRDPDSVECGEIRIGFYLLVSIILLFVDCFIV